MSASPRSEARCRCAGSEIKSYLNGRRRAELLCVFLGVYLVRQGPPNLSTLAGGGQSSAALVHDVPGADTSFHRFTSRGQKPLRAYAAKSPTRQRSGVPAEGNSERNDCG